MKFSFFNCIVDKKKSTPDNTINIVDYINLIKSTKASHYIDVMRSRQVLETKGPDAYKKTKTKVPGTTISGIFREKKASSIIQHSGLIAIDIDAKDLPSGTNINDLKSRLSEDPYTFICHLSLSGQGLVVLVKIPSDVEKHGKYFVALEKYYATEYYIIIDQSCKNVNRQRFLSHDPELFHNGNAKKFNKILKVAETKPSEFKPVIFGTNDLDYVCKQIRDRHIDLTNDYYDWIKIGMSLSGEGESGREMFHVISRINEKYDSHETDRKFDNFLRHTDRINIGTFFFHAKEAGCELQTQETKTAIRKTVIKKRLGLKKEEILRENDDKSIIGIIEQAFDSVGDKTYAAEEDADIMGVLAEYITVLKIKYNLVTRRLEHKNREITDRIANSLYMEAKQIISHRLNNSDFNKAMDSELSLEYHPITTHLHKCAELYPKESIQENLVQQLCDCFDCENMPKDVADKFIRKWLTGFVSSAFGIHSVEVLVLMGDQGVKKTTFFENLLPRELDNYKTPHEIDESKDSDIAISENWLIYDDEFGGKSRKDEKILKKKASMQKKKVRQAYGKYAETRTRLAVLGGTTNEMHVINDPTGNRRIIPLVVKDIDHDKMKLIDRNQLFAQLYFNWMENKEEFFFTKKDRKELDEYSENQTAVKVELELFYEFYKPGREAEPTDLEKHVYLTSSMLKASIESLSGQKISQRRLNEYLKKEDIVPDEPKRINKALGRYYHLVKTFS